MEIVNLKISDITPYSKNAKKHDKKQIDNVASSIKQYGFVQPIVIDKDGVIVIGHCRYEAAKKLKKKDVPCVRVDTLTEDEVKALRIADNKLNESAWDMDILVDELEGLDFGEIDIDFGIESKKQNKSGEYSTKKMVPQYEPTGNIYICEEIYDYKKTKQYIDEIEKSTVSTDEKEFLKAAAYRHCIFNFDKIADYYANASGEMQKLMEKSALVIIDYENAIANGFTKLSSDLNEIAGDEII